MRSLTLSVLGTVVVMACAESTGPPDAGPAQQSPAVHILTWKATDGPRTFSVTRRGPAILPSLSLMPSFSSNGADTSYVVADFWAVRGEARSIQISYSSGGLRPVPVLDFTVPANALSLRPDGSTFSNGDSVLITVSIDPELLVVEFEPSGLVFSGTTPAELQLWYEGADDDLNADGVLDEGDEAIEQDLLGVWFRQTAADPWVMIGAEQSAEQEWFKLDLLHFSGYAVSW